MAEGAHCLRTDPLNYLYMAVALVSESPMTPFGRFGAKDDGGALILFVMRRFVSVRFSVVYYSPIPRYQMITRPIKVRINLLLRPLVGHGTCGKTPIPRSPILGRTLVSLPHFLSLLLPLYGGRAASIYRPCQSRGLILSP